MVFQIRDGDGKLQSVPTFQEAYDVWKQDNGIWKISYHPDDSDSLTMPNVRDNLDNSVFINSNHNLISTDLTAEAVQDTVMLQID